MCRGRNFRKGPMDLPDPSQILRRLARVVRSSIIRSRFLRRPNEEHFPMRTMDERTLSFASLAGILTLLGVAAGCSSATGAEVMASSSEAVVEDALAQAYGIFKQNFSANNEDKTFHIGFGFHPALSSQKITIDQVRN